MKRIIETDRETRRAVERFRHRIAEIGGQPKDLEWGFPNGERADFPTFTLSYAGGQLQVGVPTSWSNRVPHLMRFVKAGGPPSPDVEINIPNTLNRRVSGVYVLADDSTWLCTRGAFTAFRGKIPLETTFRHFQKWLIDVQDGDRESRVIPVVAVESESLAEHLAEFIQTVIDLKKAHKNGVEEADTALPPWHSGEEFEGLKKPTGSHTPEEYEYTHGPLCNGLFRSLKSLLAERSDLETRKNSHVDAAVVLKKNQRASIVFEIKTSASLGSQIYSAIGQLLIL